MFVRLVQESDFDAVVEMARMNAAETRAELTFNEALCRATLEQAIATASPTIWVVEDRREVIAFLLADISGFRAFDGLYTTQEILFVRPVKRGSRAAVILMKHFIDWSLRLGAKEIIGGNDNGFQSERTAKFLEHFGFVRVGFAMRRNLQNGRQDGR